MSEIPVHLRPRRLSDWINPTGAKKVHSLIDKVYKRKNLEMAWEKVKANRGSGGIDGQNLEAFEAQLDQQLDRLQRELKEDTYQPLPVRQHPIPKRDKPGEYRMLGIPAIYDRAEEQQAVYQNRRRVRGSYGKSLLRRRGESAGLVALVRALGFGLFPPLFDVRLIVSSPCRFAGRLSLRVCKVVGWSC